MTADRMPPQSLEAEQSTLGSMLIDADAIAAALEHVGASDFYREAHRTIFTGICGLFEKGEPVDLITLTSELRDQGQLEVAGGVAYLTSLMNIVPTSANVEYYAKIVREKSILRSLIRVGGQLAAMGYEDITDIDEVLSSAEQLVYNIAQNRSAETCISIGEVVEIINQDIQKMKDNKLSISGLSSGFTDLDELTGGFYPGELTLIAARPAMGKTTLALNIAANIARLGGKTVLIFSLEMTPSELTKKIISAEGRIDNTVFRTGLIKSIELDDNMLSRVRGMNLYIDGKSDVSSFDVRARARRIHAKHGLDAVFVDYVQLMRWTRDSGNDSVSENVRGLKKLAMELNIPVIALSQLNRKVDERADRRPILSDLRDSGDLEQAADQVIFIMREDCYKSNNPGYVPTNEACLFLDKQRHGPTGSVVLHFNGPFSRFDNSYSGKELF